MKKHLIKSIVLVMVITCCVPAVNAQFELVRKESHAKKIESLDVSNGGRYYLSIDEGHKCLVWDIRARAQVSVINDVYNAKFAPDGESIYVANTDNTFRLVDITGNTIREFSTSAYNQSLDRNRMFFPVDNVFISEQALFNMDKGFVKKLSYEGWGLGQDYSPAKKLLAVADVESNRIGLVEIPSGTHKGYIKTGIKNYGHKPIRFSPDGEKILIYWQDTLQVLSVSTGAVLRTWKSVGGNYRIGFAEFDPAGTDLIWSDASIDNGKVFRSEISSGKIIWQRRFDHDEKDTRSFNLFEAIAKMSADGKSLLVADVWNGQFVLDPATGKTIQEFKEILEGSMTDISVSPTKGLLTAGSSTSAFFWNLETGAMEGMYKVFDDWVHLDQFSGMLYDKNYKGHLSSVKKDKQGKVIKEYPGDYYQFETSYDQRYELSVQKATNASYASCPKGKSADILKITDLRTNAIVYNRNCAWQSAKLANTQHILALTEPDEPNTINFYDYLSGKKLFGLRNDKKGADMDFSPDDNYVITKSNGYGICIFDLKNKRSYVSDSTELGIGKNTFHYVAGFTPDNKYAVICANDELKFLDMATGKINSRETITAQMQGFKPHVGFYKNGRFAILTAGDGTVQIYDRTLKKMVARLYPFAATGDWAVLTPSGMFDASPGAQNTMYYKSGKNIAPLSTMFEKYYTPKLLPRILNGEQLDPVPDVNQLKATPVVTAEYREGDRNLEVVDNVEKIRETRKTTGSIVVRADCPDDKVSEIRLYQNGKLVETTRNLTVEDAGAGTTMTKTFAVTLNEGLNVFKAVALNSERTEGKPVVINTRLIADKKPDEPNNGKAGARLHLVVVGINSYKNSRYNLNYAQADAAAFKSAVETGAKEIFADVNTYYVTDNNATRQGIESALQQVKQKARPEDLLIFYYAGHGVMNDKKEFYLVPHDVTQLYGNDQSLAQLGLSSATILQYSKDIKAQKQLFILDACQSAAALNDAVAMRGAAEEKAIAQLARATGTHWLTASGSDQFAAEFSQLGHGSFTYCLLQAMKGDADNGDKKLTIKEIDSYLQNKVPEITQKYKGSAQYPASFGYGNDFPIVIIR